MEGKAIPRYHVDESDTVRTLTLPSWTIVAENHPISNAAHLDELHQKLGIPLPEMTFGHNVIQLKHQKSGWTYRFDTVHALQMVKNGPLEEGDGAVKVRHAEAWLKSRTDPQSQTPMPEMVPTKPYDWTYTTMYEGHIPENLDHELAFTRADPSEPSHNIPLQELQRHDPILFYAQSLLFEDELHDNGSSSLLIRLRVMPGCLFLLARFTLRVDQVLFRIFDTRIYHSFTSSPPLVIKEVVGMEAPYDIVKQRLEDPDDLIPLTDSTFIANTLGSFTPQQKQMGANTGWRGIGRKVEVVNLQI
ncbi:TIP41-domain-containing protein [Serendipita vermifera]|nr:TIP41-domain-containing protein [Serendipita vermifera]